jgi:hypothetical protein
MKTLFLSMLLLVSFSLSAKKTEIISQNWDKFYQFKIDSRIEILLNNNLSEHRLFNSDKEYNSNSFPSANDIQNKGENDKSVSKSILKYYMISFNKNTCPEYFIPREFHKYTNVK